MKQLIVIWWWEVFDTQEEYYDFLKNCNWDLLSPPKTRKKRLCDSVSQHYECIIPHMPNWLNADYESRKIRFEKHFQYLNWEWVILVWWSLWAMFLMRYLSQESFPTSVEQIHLIAWAREEEGLSGFSVWEDELKSLDALAAKKYIYHSKDDEVVLYDHWEKLSSMIHSAIFETFESRWHFLQPAFPELLENIWIYHR